MLPTTRIKKQQIKQRQCVPDKNNGIVPVVGVVSQVQLDTLESP